MNANTAVIIAAIVFGGCLQASFASNGNTTGIADATIENFTFQPAEPEAADFYAYRTLGTSLYAHGIVTLPTPCHSLEATAEKQGNAILVTLLARPSQGACIQVLQPTSFSFSIADAARLRLTVAMGGAPLALDASQEFCGGIAAIACPAGWECALDGAYPDAGGKCIPAKPA
ncbi:MAG: hypothetical protein AABW54_05105 [Candidatus Micrarchaeota archaeon]